MQRIILTVCFLLATVTLASCGSASGLNKAPRRKQRGINCAFQSTDFQPAFVPRGEELNPQRLKNLVINTTLKIFKLSLKKLMSKIKTVVFDSMS